MSEGLVTFKKLGRYGRVGNQQLQVASSIGIATKHNYEYAFPYWMNWDHRDPPEPTIIPSDEDIDIQSYFENPLPLLDESLPLIVKDVPWGYQDVVLAPGNWDLRGHMQSEKYFRHCRGVLKYYFEWSKKAISSFTSPFLMTVVEECFCCIQFRRGDYIAKAGYHTVIGKDYYEKAMKEMPAGTKWLVIHENCEAEAREIVGDDAIYIGTERHYMECKWIAGMCDHFILANSTFLWMDAWLSDSIGKIVTVPKNWFGPEAGGLPSDEIAAEGWIVI